jgi:hypothetical protein
MDGVFTTIERAALPKRAICSDFRRCTCDDFERGMSLAAALTGGRKSEQDSYEDAHPRDKADKGSITRPDERL